MSLPPTPENMSRKQILDAIRRGASLESVDLRGVDLSGISFDNLDMRDAKLAEANCTRCSFRNANLTGASLWHANPPAHVPYLPGPPQVPSPQSAFEARVYGPFLVIRSRRPLVTRARYFSVSEEVMRLGRRLGIGDADVNLRALLGAESRL